MNYLSNGAADKLATNIFCEKENASDKQEFTDALNHCLDLLRYNDYVTNINNNPISRQAAIMGQQMYEQLKQIKLSFIPLNLEANNIQTRVSYHRFVKEGSIEIMDDQMVECEDEPILTNDPMEESASSTHEVRRLESNDDDDAISVASEKEDCKLNNRPSKKRNLRPIPLEEKIKVVNLARAHPTWGISRLQKHGSKRLSTTRQLAEWEVHVKTGGSIREKLQKVEELTYKKYQEAKAENRAVTNIMLQNWALEFARYYQCTLTKFNASKPWIEKFKKQYDVKAVVL